MARLWVAHRAHSLDVGLADLRRVDSEGRGGVSTVSRNSYHSQRDKYTAQSTRTWDRQKNIRESTVAREGEVEWQR